MVWLAVTRPPMPEPDRLRGHHLDEARVVVVGLVAVDVDAQALVGGERHRELDRALAVLARQLEVRDRAHHVDAHVDRAAHQLLAAVERHDALLRKGDQLQLHLVADLLAQLEQRAHRAQLGVADVDVAAHELDAVGQLPAQHGADAALDVVDGQRLDPLGPDGDALEQRAGLVVARLADGEHGVEVDVRLDQGRRDQGAAEVDRPAAPPARAAAIRPSRMPISRVSDCPGRRAPVRSKSSIDARLACRPHNYRDLNFGRHGRFV